MTIKNLIIFSTLLLTACDLEFIDSGLNGNRAYIINAEVAVRSNTDFPIASAEVKMEWRIDDYYISNRDSNYTDSEGLVQLDPVRPNTTDSLPTDVYASTPSPVETQHELAKHYQEIHNLGEKEKGGKNKDG